MRLYRSDDISAERQWAGTQDEANRLWGRGSWEQVEVPTDKPGLLAWLNANGPDSRADIEPVAAPSEVSEAPASYAAVSIAIDEAWEALPLARKLSFAAMALEDAREIIKPR